MTLLLLVSLNVTVRYFLSVLFLACLREKEKIKRFLICTKEC